MRPAPVTSSQFPFILVYACALSDVSTGMEALLLLALTTNYGTFASLTAYLFFFISGEPVH